MAKSIGGLVNRERARTARLKSFERYTSIVNSSKNFEEAFSKVRNIRDVPANVAARFWKTFGGEGSTPVSAFRNFYNTVKK